MYVCVLACPRTRVLDLKMLCITVVLNWMYTDDIEVLFRVVINVVRSNYWYRLCVAAPRHPWATSIYTKNVYPISVNKISNKIKSEVTFREKEICTWTKLLSLLWFGLAFTSANRIFVSFSCFSFLLFSFFSLLKCKEGSEEGY